MLISANYKSALASKTNLGPDTPAHSQRGLYTDDAVCLFYCHVHMFGDRQEQTHIHVKLEAGERREMPRTVLYRARSA